MTNRIKPKNKTALIIEDNPTYAQMCIERILAEGYDIIWAKDGQEGIRLIITEKPDAILLDLLLPGKGGLGILQIVRSLPTTQNIPVIVLSAYAKDEYIETARRYGIEQFLNKATATPKDIIIHLNSAVQKKSTSQTTLSL